MTVLSKRTRAIAATAAAFFAAIAVAACGGSSTASSAGAGGNHHGPFKVYLSMSYTGNTWQTEAANLVKAEAATPPYNKLVNLSVQVAGTSVPTQISNINNEVAAGANAIIVYPISPTALNPAIQAACARHVVVLAYDSLVTAPCAYNIHDNVTQMAQVGMKWLAQKMTAEHLKNLAILTGVAGTSANADYEEGVSSVLKHYPNINVVATAPGNWDQATIKTAFSGMLASHPNIQAVWGTLACNSVYQVLASQGKAQIPCAGSDSNSERALLLPKSEGGQNADDITVSALDYSGELALMDAVKVLQGHSVPHDTILPTIAVTKSNVKLGTNPAAGANVFRPGSVPVNMTDTFWSPLVNQGLQAQLTGKPDVVSSQPKPCSAVPGCVTQNALVFNKTYPGGN